MLLNMKEIKDVGRWSREKIVDELAAKFRMSPSIFITQFRGLKVNDLQDLRNRLRKKIGSFLVVKNSLCRLAFEKTHTNCLTNLVSGQTGIVLGGDDPVLISKILMEFSQASSDFQIKGGLFQGEFITFEQIKQLSSLPGRGVLLGRVCSNLKASLCRLVYSLGLINKLVLVLKNKEKQN